MQASRPEDPDGSLMSSAAGADGGWELPYRMFRMPVPFWSFRVCVEAR